MVRKFFKTTGMSLALLLTLSLTGSLHAQTSLGQIAGSVVDATGSVIPGATITITNVGPRPYAMSTPMTAASSPPQISPSATIPSRLPNPASVAKPARASPSAPTLT